MGIEGIEKLPPPGNYLVQVSEAGEIRFLSKLISIPRAENKKEILLGDLWDNSILEFSFFKSELNRYQILSEDNELRLKGKQLKALYEFLSKHRVLPMGLEMKAVYDAFCREFTLKFKGERSLQSLRDTEKYQAQFEDIFSFFVSKSNEINKHKN